MRQLSISEFSRQSRLSPKALRLYDELGLVQPARVDPDSGYRWYEPAQLDRARLVAHLREIGMPLAEVRAVVSADPVEAAQRVAKYWTDVEAAHTSRRRLADYLVDHLSGKGSMMYEVDTRRTPERKLLCLKRNVDEDGAWALGKEFVGILKERPLPRLPGRPGAAFVIYHGEVSADSDGPVEWCRPVEGDADDYAVAYPELTWRTEPAHDEAFVQLGTGEISRADWHVVSESLHAWAAAGSRRPSELAPRITFQSTPPITAESRPDRDFAVPLGGSDRYSGAE
jgi:DNA-binding transcriptional MerR regulator